MGSEEGIPIDIQRAKEIEIDLSKVQIFEKPSWIVWEWLHEPVPQVHA